MTGQKTREKLVSCETFAADEKIRKVAFEKNDERISAIASDELIAKEASYHKSCYSAYTILLYHVDRTDSQKETVSDVAFNLIKDQLLSLYDNPDVIELTYFTKQIDQYLLGKGYDAKEIDSAKKKLETKN